MERLEYGKRYRVARPGKITFVGPDTGETRFIGTDGSVVTLKPGETYDLVPPPGPDGTMYDFQFDKIDDETN